MFFSRTGKGTRKDYTACPPDDTLQSTALAVPIAVWGVKSGVFRHP